MQQQAVELGNCIEKANEVNSLRGKLHAFESAAIQESGPEQDIAIEDSLEQPLQEGVPWKTIISRCVLGQEAEDIVTETQEHKPLQTLQW
jgi:hypothetical protein